MRRLGVIATALALVSGACIAGGSDAVTVLVDYSHDEFASFVAKNFPRQVAVHPGTELVFKQTWTGEPHSVTGGTLANDLMEAARPYLEMQERGEPIPDEPPKKIMMLEEKVVWAFDHSSDEFDISQTGAQPCYLESGEPPKDGKPCKRRAQPAFTGRQTIYNSGIIPYSGPGGNEYRVNLADDISPGSYWFYCNYHGEFQSTEVVVKPRTEKVPSPAQVAVQARKEIEKVMSPFVTTFEDAADDRQITLTDLDQGGEHAIKGTFAGLWAEDLDLWHSINEFIPKRIKAKAGEEITWNLLGFHTISFGVPPYFPIFTFKENGTVERNEKLDPPAGGANEFDLPEEELFDEDRTEPLEFDGGSYDGSGFWSSGTMEAGPYLKYTMRITEPGTYRYACLIHPPMVGTVEVTP